MSNELLEQSYNTGSTSNNQGFNNASALVVRLDTQPLLENIEMFLRRSRKETYMQEDGTTLTKFTEFSSPVASEEGVQSILCWCQSIINQHVSQGNFVEDGGGLGKPRQSQHYWEFISGKSTEFLDILMINQYRWGISDADLRMIYYTVVSVMETFLTRLIGNKERESFTNTLTHNETNKVQGGGSSGGLFSNIFGGKQ